MYDLYNMTENKESISKLTIYNAIKFVSKAWENVKSETIIRSWKKVGILPEDDLDDYEDSEDSVASELQDLMNKHYNEPLTTGDYVNYESNNETEAMPELEEIAAVVLNEEEEEEEEVVHIKTKDALKNCEDLLIYTQQGEVFIVEEFILDGLQKLKKQLISQKFKESKQT
ncbi:2450_t:CDS:1, partial [Entrophospora sp. SA101]